MILPRPGIGWYLYLGPDHGFFSPGAPGQGARHNGAPLSANSPLRADASLGQIARRTGPETAIAFIIKAFVGGGPGRPGRIDAARVHAPLRHPGRRTPRGGRLPAADATDSVGGSGAGGVGAENASLRMRAAMAPAGGVGRNRGQRHSRTHDCQDYASSHGRSPSGPSRLNTVAAGFVPHSDGAKAAEPCGWAGPCRPLGPASASTRRQSLHGAISTRRMSVSTGAFKNSAAWSRKGRPRVFGHSHPSERP
jgi:hypothetical protein